MEEAAADDSGERHGKDYNPWDGKHNKRVSTPYDICVRHALFQYPGETVAAFNVDRP